MSVKGGSTVIHVFKQDITVSGNLVETETQKLGSLCSVQHFTTINDLLSCRPVTCLSWDWTISMIHGLAWGGGDRASSRALSNLMM